MLQQRMQSMKAQSRSAEKHSWEVLCFAASAHVIIDAVLWPRFRMQNVTQCMMQLLHHKGFVQISSCREVLSSMPSDIFSYAPCLSDTFCLRWSKWLFSTAKWSNWLFSTAKWRSKLFSTAACGKGIARPFSTARAVWSSTRHEARHGSVKELWSWEGRVVHVSTIESGISDCTTQI